MVVEGTIQAFFSYSHCDWKVAKRHGPIPNILGHLFDQIECEVRAVEGVDRFTKWVDQERLRWADQWSDELERAIAASELFFVFLSPGWLNSKVCRRELETFRDRQNGLGGKRVFVAQIQPINPKQQSDHRQILAELRHLQCKDDWESLLTADEDARVRACQKAGHEVVAQIEALASAPLPSAPSSSLPSCAPTPLSDQRRLASGRLEVPSQGGVVNNSALVNLYLAFRGWGEVETEKGTLVFGAQSATLIIFADGTEILPHHEFETDHRPSRIGVHEYVSKAKIEYRIVARNGILDGNVIHSHEYSLPVVEAKVPATGKATVNGKVELRNGDILIDEELSELNDPADLATADAKALKSMRKELARMILEAHFKEFELAGCAI